MGQITKKTGLSTAACVIVPLLKNVFRVLDLISGVTDPNAKASVVIMGWLSAVFDALLRAAAVLGGDDCKGAGLRFPK